MRHGIAEDYIMDPIPAVESVLSRGEMVNIMQALQIPVFKNHEDFLTKLAIKKKLTRKGGDPDILLAARSFLKSLGSGTYPTSTFAPSNSKSRFDMPKWYSDIDTEKVLLGIQQNINLIPILKTCILTARKTRSTFVRIKPKDSSFSILGFQKPNCFSQSWGYNGV